MLTKTNKQTHTKLLTYLKKFMSCPLFPSASLPFFSALSNEAIKGQNFKKHYSKVKNCWFGISNAETKNM